MWKDGVLLGVKGSTGELIVGDERGVWKTRTVRRKTNGERWRAENAKMVGGVPWKVSVNDPNGDGEDMKTNVTVMDREYREKLAKEAEELEKDKGEEFSSAGGAVVAADVNTDDLVALALASCR